MLRIVFAIIGIVSLIVLGNALYSVHQTQQALVLQFVR